MGRNMTPTSSLSLFAYSLICRHSFFRYWKKSRTEHSVLTGLNFLQT